MANKPSVRKVKQTSIKVGFLRQVPVRQVIVGDLLVIPDARGQLPDKPSEVLKVRRTKEFVYLAFADGKLRVPVKKRVPVVTAIAVVAMPVRGNATVH